jgi:hypothetical protein
MPCIGGVMSSRGKACGPASRKSESEAAPAARREAAPLTAEAPRKPLDPGMFIAPRGAEEPAGAETTNSASAGEQSAQAPRLATARRS